MKGWRETRRAFPGLVAVWQRDGEKMARAWPSHRAGRLTVGGPSWRAEDRQEWRKCFEVATHPSTVRDGWSRARENAAAERDGDRSESGFLIFLMHAKTADAPVYRPSFLLSLARERKEEMKQGEWKRRGTGVSYIEGSIRGEGKAKFWQLGLWRRKIKSTQWKLDEQ